MATLAGNTIASTYPLLLKIDSSGIDGTLRAVQDGDATDSALSIATDSVLVKGSGIRLYFHDADGGEHIAGDGTDLTISSGAKINLTSTTDVHVANGTGIVVGHTAQVAMGEVTAETQILGTTETDATLAIGLFSATDALSPSLKFVKGGHATIGSNTTVADNEELGKIQAYGSDGSDHDTLSSEIAFNIDDDGVGAGTLGGEILLKTSGKDGTLDTAVTIDSSQNVGIGTGSPGYALDILNSTTPQLNISNTASNDTAKFSQITTSHYHNAEEPMTMIEGRSDGSQNYVRLGGGRSEGNSMTILEGYFGGNDATPSGTKKFSFDESSGYFLQNIGIGDTAPEGTIGLTINQGANDDGIFFLKSSDITHTVTGIAEADTYFFISKADGAVGGAMLTGITEETGADNALVLRGILGADNMGGDKPAVQVRGAMRSGTGITNLAADDVIFQVSNSDASANYATFTAAGNVGIGDSAPVAKLQVQNTGAGPFLTAANATAIFSGSVDIGKGGAIGFDFGSGHTNYPVGIGYAVASQTGSTNGHLVFGTRGATTDSAPTERMRITSGGNIHIGCTAVPSASVAGLNLSGTNSGCISSSGSSTSAYNHWLFYNGNGLVGNINTSGSATAFVTSSDYRLKENEVLISDGLTRLNQLKPYRFNFKSDADKTVDGFFAHEVSDIVPEAIHGEKDAVDDDGNAEMQGIDHSKLVPLLVKAVQELSAKVTALENA